MRSFGLGRDRRSARGMALAESALIIVIFFVFILGVLEIGRFLSVQLTLTNAAREGARLAVVPTAGGDALPSDAEIESWVGNFLRSNGLSDATVTVERNVLAARGDVSTRVIVSFPYQLLTTSMFSDLEVTLSGTSKMRNEATN